MPNWTISKILDFKEVASEGLKENEEILTGNWRKGDPHYVLTESLATVTRSNVEVKNILCELDDPAKEISSQSCENATEMLLTVKSEKTVISRRKNHYTERTRTR